ncbi:MAG: hypothetical protein ABI178_06530 [Rhodanobacter sp.]
MARFGKDPKDWANAGHGVSNRVRPSCEVAHRLITQSARMQWLLPSVEDTEMKSRPVQLLPSCVLAGICALAFAAPALADNSCDAPYSAVVKSTQTPRHVYSTRTHSAQEMQDSDHFKRLTGKPTYSSKTEISESIVPGGAFDYGTVKGQWKRQPSSAKDNLEMAQDRLNAHEDTCTLVGDQTADGQSVTVYQLHRKGADDHADTQLRVLKSSGLFEGQTTKWPGGSSIVTRYDYNNVQPPANVK